MTRSPLIFSAAVRVGALAAFVPAPTYLYASTLGGIFDAFALSLSGGVSVALGVAVAVFVWGVVSSMTQAGDDKSRVVGRQRMVWGVVGLVVIVSMWTIVQLLKTMVGVQADPTVCDSPWIETGGGALEAHECFGE
jgi:hypothetical protein